MLYPVIYLIFVISRFKFNISISELCQTVMKGVLELSIKEGGSSKAEMLKELDKVSISLK